MGSRLESGCYPPGFQISKAKTYVTCDSRVVPHRSTEQAQWCLTSEFGRDLVLSPWYERMMGVQVPLGYSLSSNPDFRLKCSCRGSNPGPSAHKTEALPTAPQELNMRHPGIEPGAPRWQRGILPLNQWRPLVSNSKSDPGGTRTPNRLIRSQAR